MRAEGPPAVLRGPRGGCDLALAHLQFRRTLGYKADVIDGADHAAAPRTRLPPRACGEPARVMSTLETCLRLTVTLCELCAWYLCARGPRRHDAEIVTRSSRTRHHDRLISDCAWLTVYHSIDPKGMARGPFALCTGHSHTHRRTRHVVFPSLRVRQPVTPVLGCARRTARTTHLLARCGRAFRFSGTVPLARCVAARARVLRSCGCAYACGRTGSRLKTLLEKARRGAIPPIVR